MSRPIRIGSLLSGG